MNDYKVAKGIEINEVRELAPYQVSSKAKCHGCWQKLYSLDTEKSLICNMWQTSVMPVPFFAYYHKECFEKKGN